MIIVTRNTGINGMEYLLDADGDLYYMGFIDMDK
jgi:hypothetical protein